MTRDELLTLTDFAHDAMVHADLALRSLDRALTAASAGAERAELLQARQLLAAAHPAALFDRLAGTFAAVEDTARAGDRLLVV